VIACSWRCGSRVVGIIGSFVAEGFRSIFLGFHLIESEEYALNCSKHLFLGFCCVKKEKHAFDQGIIKSNEMV